MPDSKSDEAAGCSPELEVAPEHCTFNAGYLADRGRIALTAGKFDSAVTLLERAVMLNSSDGAAQVDYAEALFRAGNVRLANAINTQLLRRNDLPALLRLELQRRLQEWQSPPAPPAVEPSARLDIELGYSNNLNNGSTVPNVDLRLGDSIYSLTLDSDQLASPGLYTRAVISERAKETLQYVAYKTSEQGFDRSLKVGSIWFHSQIGESTVRPELAFSLGLDQADLSLASDARAVLIDYQGGSSVRLGLFGGGVVRSDALRAGALHYGVDMSHNLSTPLGQLSIDVRLLEDRALYQRAGGKLLSADYGVKLRRGVGNGVLGLNWSLRDEWGDEPYSGLLTTQASLRNRWDIKLVGYTIALSSQLVLGLEARHLKMSSNIDILRREHSEFSARISYALR